MSDDAKRMSELGQQAQRVLAQMAENDRLRERIERAERAALAQWRRDEAKEAYARRRAENLKKPMRFGDYVMMALFLGLLGLSTLWVLSALASIASHVLGF